MNPYTGVTIGYYIPLIAGIIASITLVIMAYRLDRRGARKTARIMIASFLIVSLGAIFYAINMQSMSQKSYHNKVVEHLESMGMGIAEGFENKEQVITSEEAIKVVIETPNNGLTRCRGMVENNSVQFLCQDENRDFTIPLDTLK